MSKYTRGIRFVLSIWKSQKAAFYCVSTKSGSGKWKDHFFEPGDFKDLDDFIEDHDGEDVYFCPHGFKRRSRTAEEAVLPMMLWADLDEVDPSKLGKLKPTWAWESSPGRYAAVWLIDERMTPVLNKRLTYQIGADKGGWDVTQVLRFPGTINRKYKSRPVVTPIWSDGPEYEARNIDRLVADLDEEDEESGLTARDILYKHRKRIKPNTKRAIMSPMIPTDRSTVIWKTIKDLVEAGLDEDEVLVVMSGTPLCKDKYHGRNMERALRQQIAKAVSEKLRGVSDKPKKRDEDEGEEDDEDEYRWFGKSMAEIEEKEVDWIAYPFLARGEITIVEGLPDVGKSWLCMWLAMCICDGKRIPAPWPTGTKNKTMGPVLYCDLENSADKVTKGRLIGSGIEHQENWFSEERPFSVADEDTMQEVVAAMKRLKPALIVFDTLNTYIGENTDTGTGNKTQHAMNQFKQIARDLNCAVLVLRHWTKGREGRDAREYGQGNMAMMGAARIAIAVREHPEQDEYPNTRVAVMIKNNLTKKPRGLGLFYQLETTGKRTGVVMDGWHDIDEGFLAGAGAKKPGEKEQKTGAKEAREAAEEMLLPLVNQGREVEERRIRNKAEQKNLDMKDVMRAAKKLGIVIHKGMWRLETK